MVKAAAPKTPAPQPEPVGMEVETRGLLSNLLRNPAGENALPPALESELLRKGAVISLQQDASEDSIQVLREVCLSSPMEGVQSLALEALVSLARAGNARALESVFRLAIEHDLAAARAAIAAHGLPAPAPERQAAFLLLSGQAESARALDPDFHLLTSFTLEEASPELAARLTGAAGRAGLGNWITLIRALQQPNEQTAAELQARYPAFAPSERDLARRLLVAAAQNGEISAQESLCQLFIRYEDAQARAAVLEHGQKALFLFLSQQWEAYERFDFDHRLLIAAYATADLSMRKRLLDISRQSGQMEWFGNLSGANRTRWLRDLSDADWETAIHGLEQAGRYAELWRLSQLSSPLWSAYILRVLESAGWQPEPAHEQEGFALLARLAQTAAKVAPEIRARRTFHVSSMDDLRSMAISPDGKTIAFGSSSNAIHLWSLGGTPRALQVLHAASTQTHALAFSPDGAHLAAAVADQTIRVYQWEDGRGVKALQGHTGLVRSIAIAPDGRAIYSAGFDGTLRAWRFPYGPDSKVLARSEGEYFAVAISPDGSALIAAGADKVLEVYQLPEGGKVRELAGHSATVTLLATAPASQYVASYSRDQSIRVWNTVSGRAVQTIAYGSEPVTGLCIHPNEQIIISAGYKGQLHLWNMSTGRALQELTHHKRAVIGLALTPNGDTLISASSDGSVTLWNLEIFLLTRQPVEDMALDRAGAVQKEIEANAVTALEKNWLAFTLELLRWKQRFDIQLEGGRTISIGEFDIQL
jgi:WD40 repeat protein